MSRSPLVVIVSIALGPAILGGCGSDDDAAPTTTAAQAPSTDDAARELSLCAPLAAVVGIFTDMEDVATGSEEGRVAADASLTTALNQIDELAADPSPEVTQAVEALREVRFSETGSPPEGGTIDPDGPESDAAVATLSAELGGPCGDLGG